MWYVASQWYSEVIVHTYPLDALIDVMPKLFMMVLINKKKILAASLATTHVSSSCIIDLDILAVFCSTRISILLFFFINFKIFFIFMQMIMTL